MSSKLYIGTDLLDFNEGFNVVRQVMDWRDVDIGNRTKSYTLDIPLTRTNRQKLNFPGTLTSIQQISQEVRLISRGVELIRGTLRVIGTNRTAIRAIIDADDWVQDIDGISIRELSWVSGDEHEFTSANVVASWTAAAGALYRYPLINYAELHGEGWGADSSVYPWDFYPSWNISDIIEKIFGDAGYQIASNGFLDSATGQALYLHSAPVPRSQDFIGNKGLSVYVNDSNDNKDSGTVQPTDPITLTVDQTLVIDGETTDEGADFSTTTHKYTVPETGVYRFKAHVNVFSTMNIQDGVQFTVSYNQIIWSIKKNSATVIVSENITGNDTFDSGNSFDLDTGWIYLEANDTIEVDMMITATGTNIDLDPQTPQLYITAGATTSYLELIWDERCLWPGLGQTISPTEFLPDINSLDLIKALKVMYNLRFWMDRMNRTIYIETADDFYGSTVVDWSDKIDYSKEIEAEIIAYEYKKRQVFRYRADDADKAYSTFGSIPFEKIYEMTSLYSVPGEEVRGDDLIAPTVTGVMFQIGHTVSQIPRIFGGAEFVSPARAFPQYRPQNWEPRIFEWKGMVSLTNGSFNYYENIEDTSASNYTTFPSMETPSWVDLYDDYWRKTIRYIDYNRILTAHLRLSITDILPFITVHGTAATEGFRATYKLNIDGQDMYFLISKITTDGNVAKVEMIQKM